MFATGSRSLHKGSVSLAEEHASLMRSNNIRCELEESVVVDTPAVQSI